MRWAVIGSVASALQGCQVSPRDIDLLAFRPACVYKFAELMSAYTPPRCDCPEGHANWCSSLEQPVVAGPDDYGFDWHFGRWFVQDFRVEIAHIVAPEGFPTSLDGAGIWEAGPEIWPYLRIIPFADYHLPVVPLEIQLETNLQRGLSGRAEEIVAILRWQGYNRALLEQALSKEHKRV